jgi:hypothetical protein
LSIREAKASYRRDERHVQLHLRMIKELLSRWPVINNIPTLYDILPGYLPMPLLGIDADNLADYIAKHRDLTGWWWNFDRYMVSLRS